MTEFNFELNEIQHCPDMIWFQSCHDHCARGINYKDRGKLQTAKRRTKKKRPTIKLGSLMAGAIIAPLVIQMMKSSGIKLPKIKLPFGRLEL